LPLPLRRRSLTCGPSTTPKKEMTAEKYLFKMAGFRSELAAAGKTIDDEEMIVMTCTDDTKQVCQSLELQVQSDLEREIFPIRMTRGLISNSQETVEKDLSVLVKQPARQVPCLVSPNPPSGCKHKVLK
jgi:hypothetical protein